MKLLIASDIHGSAYYARLLLERFHAESADRLVLLGDLLYHGPRNDLPKDYAPKAVINLLNAEKNKILAVRGNCDTEVDQMVLEFPILAHYAVIDCGDRLIYASHGHVYHPSHLPPMNPHDIFLSGHTHVPLCTRNEDGVLCLNPGSVSIPKEGSAHGYMLCEAGVFTWKDLDGNEQNRLAL